ncbi:B12-binding domain-containing radical SAM protein [Nocardia sp. A7]|uniref:B12-binding domain-containing radical SAM protein n=1 Tax=Nocardia sp. A7 TaxID=2789274 RepID=UPI00397B6D40
MDLTSAVSTRILDIVARVGGDVSTTASLLPNLHASEPNPLRAALTTTTPARVVVTGTVEHRLLLAQHDDPDRWTVAELSGTALGKRDWPSWAREGISLADTGSWVSTAIVSPVAVHRLTRPDLLLAALYHPEHFPLPRFPLAISDLARAARTTLSGHTTLMDMQLGVALDDITAAITTTTPDIVGISATFGQHDLLVKLLDAIDTMPQRPLVLVGGSLTARNEHLLLERWPWLIVARGAGEPTVADTVAYFHRDIEFDQIRGIGYTGAARGEGALTVGRYRRSAVVPNRARTDIFPELDLLAATFAHHGVAQLEASRGCTNFCSFCPRGHKGSWSGIAADALPTIVEAMSEVFDRHPHIGRTLYLVDEEFIGRGPDALDRAIEVADVLDRHRFRWETSCRIDQVVRTDTDRQWHIDRAHMWRTLCAKGLRRCLFGVESGVTSILERFNKETTSEQNALAIRTLSALGVPTRFTYITFDHLMTEAEFRATVAFQARTDLILKPLPHLSVDEIVDGVADPDFIATHSTGRPFCSAISYMMVSMECLIGAAYTKQVAAAGLAGDTRPSMGRLDAEFADRRIGLLSRHAQLWVDSNFALDYTLKSLEKVLDGPARHAARGTRVVIKSAAFALLGDMLDILTRTPVDTVSLDAMGEQVRARMEARRAVLIDQMSTAVAELEAALPATDHLLLDAEFTRWQARTGWELINAADPCGT